MIDLDCYPYFNKNKKSLKETSRDDSDLSNIQYMTQSELEVIDFDLVKRDYTNGLKLSEEGAASVDALIKFDNHIAFVEFKNGVMKKKKQNVKDKMRDSLLVFSDITKKDIAYTRQNADFILVYNLDKNPTPNQDTKGMLQESPSLIDIENFIALKAKKEIIRFDLEKYEKLYFRKVHTYSKEQFENYLNIQ